MQHNRGGMMLTRILPQARTWSCQTYNWQPEREEVQLTMWWMMIEEQWSWEEERITVWIAAMLMRIGMGTDMGMGSADAMMQSQ